MAVPPVINEFVASHTGTDNHEYVEIFGDPSTSYSTLTIVQIEGDASVAGTIDSATPVGSTDAGGYWVSGFLNNVLENNTMTLLLVENFTGTVGNDLDTDNNGTLDSTPWSSILDAVAVSDGGATDRTYGTPVLTTGYDGLAFWPGGASRIPNGTDTDAVSDWARNDFDLEGLPGFDGTPVTGEALNTPGAVNQLSYFDGPVINEFVFNHDGLIRTSMSRFGEASTDYSHLTLITIEDGLVQASPMTSSLGTTDADGFDQRFIAETLEKWFEHAAAGRRLLRHVGQIDNNDGISTPTCSRSRGRRRVKNEASPTDLFGGHRCRHDGIPPRWRRSRPQRDRHGRRRGLRTTTTALATRVYRHAALGEAPNTPNAEPDCDRPDPAGRYRNRRGRWPPNH
jgi:hypothetical protein